MNLFEILRTIWRHRLVVLPVVLLTVAGVVYVGVLAPATYRLTASYVLIPPPNPPSEAEIERDPSLAEVDPQNPFLRFPGQSVVVDLLARRVDDPRNREALVAAGADDRFTVVPSNRFGFSSPIIDVEALSPTSEGAVATARLVTASVESELERMQVEQGVAQPYMFRPLLVSFPPEAERIVTNTMRAVIAVGAGGALLLFIVVSVAEGVTQSRRGRASSRFSLGAHRDLDDDLRGGLTDDADWRLGQFDVSGSGRGGQR